MVSVPGAGAASGVFTHDGLTLVAEDHAVAKARADLLVVHGFGEHRGRYRHVVAALTATRYASHLFDLRGHGGSQGSRGHVAQFADFRDDVDRVVGRLAGPRVMLAHSMGGLITLDHVLHQPGVFASLILSSSFLAPAFRVLPVERVLGVVLAHLAPTRPFKPRLPPLAQPRSNGGRGVRPRPVRAEPDHRAALAGG